MLRKLTEHIFYLPEDSRTDRPLLAAILGRKHVLMIDAGSSPKHANLFLESLQQVTPRKPTWVVLTHWHWDHTFGLSSVAVPTIGQKNIARHLSQLKGRSWDDAALSRHIQAGEFTAFSAEHIRKEYGVDRDIHIVLPAIYFDKSLLLDLGDITCELLHIPTDHSDDVVAVHVREEKTLFRSDALGPDLDASTPYYSASKVKQLSRFIQSFSVDWLVESHSAPASV